MISVRTSIKKISSFGISRWLGQLISRVLGFIFNSSHTPLYTITEAPNVTPVGSKAHRKQNLIFSLLILGLVVMATQLGFGLSSTNSASALSVQAAATTAAPATSVAITPAATVPGTTQATLTTATMDTIITNSSSPSATKLPSGVANISTTPHPVDPSLIKNPVGNAQPVLGGRPFPTQEAIQSVDWNSIALMAAHAK